VVAAGVLGLSGCGGEKTSGIAPYTPGASKSASPTTTSNWTPEQQQVIEATMAYRALIQKYSRGTMVDRAELRTVATEQRAVDAEKAIVGGLTLGYILSGEPDLDEVRAVTITGAKSVLTECWIGRSYGVKKAASPPVTAMPQAPLIVNMKLTRADGKWRVSGSTPGAACAAKG
jgi:hypothetical protein